MKIAHAIFGIVLSGVLSYGCCRALSSSALKHTAIISLDPLLSYCSQQDMMSVLETKYHQRPMIWCADVQQKFPHIKKISTTYTVPGVPVIAVQAYAPRLRVNNELLMLEDGSLVQRNLYQASFVDQLTEIRVTLPLIDQAALLHFSQAMTPLLYDRFGITWHSATHIALHDKQMPHFTVVCDYEHLPTAPMIAHCETIYQKLENAKNQGTCITDMRFEKQIVAYIAKEGCNGQHIA